MWGDDDSVVMEDPALRTDDKRSGSPYGPTNAARLKSMDVEKAMQNMVVGPVVHQQKEHFNKLTRLKSAKINSRKSALTQSQKMHGKNELT